MGRKAAPWWAEHPTSLSLFPLSTLFFLSFLPTERLAERFVCRYLHSPFFSQYGVLIAGEDTRCVKLLLQGVQFQGLTVYVWIQCTYESISMDTQRLYLFLLQLNANKSKRPRTNCTDGSAVVRGHSDIVSLLLEGPRTSLAGI
jgi:hypothetical protein